MNADDGTGNQDQDLNSQNNLNSEEQNINCIQEQNTNTNSIQEQEQGSVTEVLPEQEQNVLGSASQVPPLAPVLPTQALGVCQPTHTSGLASLPGVAMQSPSRGLHTLMRQISSRIQQMETVQQQQLELFIAAIQDSRQQADNQRERLRSEQETLIQSILEVRDQQAAQNLALRNITQALHEEE